MIDYGDDDWTVLSDTTHRARKDYRCGECRRVIAAGDTYRRHVAIERGGGPPSTERLCAHCDAVKSSNCRLGLIGGYTFRAQTRALRDDWWIQPSAMVGAGVLGWRRDVQPVVLLGVGIGRGRLGVDMVVAPAGHQGFAGVIGRVRL